jgi:hypothetical protein
MQSQREKMATYKPKRETQENPTLIFTLKLQNCTTFLLCKLPVCGALSKQPRNCDSVTCATVAHRLFCVA